MMNVFGLRPPKIVIPSFWVTPKTKPRWGEPRINGSAEDRFADGDPRSGGGLTIGISNINSVHCDSD